MLGRGLLRLLKFNLEIYFIHGVQSYYLFCDVDASLCLYCMFLVFMYLFSLVVIVWLWFSRKVLKAIVCIGKSTTNFTQPVTKIFEVPIQKALYTRWALFFMKAITLIATKKKIVPK